MPANKPATRALEWVLSQDWAIHAPALMQIIGVIERTEAADFEALAEQLGRPLENTQKIEMRGRDAVLPIRGPIARYGNIFSRISGATSLDVLSRDFQVAERSQDVDRIVLWIDSPGGDVTGISEFASQVAESRKNTVAYIEGLGASAAYWIASAANQIVALDTAQVGSIGVIASYRPPRDGAIEIVNSQSPLKGKDPRTDEGRQEVQERVNALADVFINTVARNRVVSYENVVENFGRGGLLIANQAMHYGMVDEINTLDGVLSGAAYTRGQNMPKEETKAERPEITRAYLDANHADLVKAIQESAYDRGHEDGYKDAEDEAFNAGKEAERERIKSVRAQALPGHEDLIEQLAFDGETTGEQAAMAIVTAEREKREKVATDIRSETPKPLSFADAGDDAAETVDPNLPLEDRCKAEWDQEPKLRAEFGSLSAYVAFQQAEADGRLKILKRS